MPDEGSTLSQPGKGDGNRFLPTAVRTQSAGGLVAVCVGVSAISALSGATMFVINQGNSTSLIPLVTAAFGVISAIVGAYLGIKIGTEQSTAVAQNVAQNATESATENSARLVAVQQFVSDEDKDKANKASDAAAAATSRTKGTPRGAPAPVSVADELTKLGNLRDRNMLTDQEFAAQKLKILG